MFKKVIGQTPESEANTSTKPASNSFQQQAATSSSAAPAQGSSRSSSASGRNVLSSDVEIKGNVKFQNDLEVDGKIEGDISSDGSLTVGKNAEIKAEIDMEGVKNTELTTMKIAKLKSDNDIEQKAALDKLNKRKKFDDDLLALKGDFGQKEIGLAISGVKAWEKIQAAGGIKQSLMNIPTKPLEAFQNTSSAYPFPIGPILGAAHAAVTLALGVQQLAAFRKGFYSGGMVDVNNAVSNTIRKVSGGAGSMDGAVARVNHGEGVVPAKNMNEVLDDWSSRRDGGGSGGNGETHITIELDGEAVSRVVVDRLTGEGVI